MKFLSIFLIAFLLSGCKSKSIENQNITPVNAISNLDTKTEIYNLFLQNENYILKNFEPKESIYNGIFLEDKESDFITQFEQKNNINHSIYLYNMKLDEEYPLSWILNCYSKYKTPFITIYPPDDITKMFDNELIKKLAKDFGELNIPLFINFYPLSEKNSTSCENYKSFFKLAKTFFEMYAKNVCFIWSIDSNFAYNSKKFYPGDEYVDWVGINIEENILEDNQLKIIFNEIDVFYKTYEKLKPIAISSLAISHFSNKTLSYNIENKIKELERFYSYIPSKYPRIKMINYINYDTFKDLNKKNKQNYSINDNKEIFNAYKNLISNEKFSKSVVTTNFKRQSLEKIKLPFLVYKKDNSFFLCEKAIKSFGYENLLQTLEKYYINWDILFNLEQFAKKCNLSIYIDEKNKNVILSSM